jgi:hypothetical protein
VDEIEKIRGDSPWLDAIRPELFFLLDGQFPDAVLHHVEDGELVDLDDIRTMRERLSEGMLVVGAGAFQPYWDEHSRSSVGFHDVHPASDARISQAQMATMIPVEIVNRFVAPVLCLSPLRRVDYEAMMAEAVADLPVGLGDAVRRNAEATIDEAIRNRLAARWIEQLVLHALIESSDSRHICRT